MGDPASSAVAMEIAPEVLAGAGGSSAGPLSSLLAGGAGGSAFDILPGLQSASGGIAPMTMPGGAGGGGFMSALSSQMKSNPMMAMLLGKSMMGNPSYGPQGTPPMPNPQPKPMGSMAPWGSGGTQMPAAINPATMGGSGNDGGMQAMLRMLMQLQGR